MTYILDIAKLGNPVLRKPAQPVSLPADEQTIELCRSMLLTLRESCGVGLAATQVYQSKQIMIVHSYPNRRYPNAPSFGPEIIINPVITNKSEQIAEDWEGCLSIPGLRARIPRAETVQLEYSTMDNQQKSQTFSGFPARIVQHEYDHLIGKVFLDRVVNTEHIYTELEYLKWIVNKQE